MTQNRFDRLLQLMSEHQLDTIALNPGFNLRYLTGLNYHLMERPVVLFLHQSGKAVMVLPQLEVSRAESSHISAQLFPYDDNPANWARAFHLAMQAAGITTQKIGIEPAQLRFLEYDYIQKAAPQANVQPAQDLFAELRLLKDEAEIENMRTAAQIAQKGLSQTLPLIKIGMSEKEIASELVFQCLKAGAEGELPFQPIVASGPNSADPHAVPTDRKISSGDILLFDWGVRYAGYASDITRCFAIEQVDSAMAEVASIVLEANTAGRHAGRPGMRSGNVDMATRHPINKAHYGDYFIHRTGHGLGMDAHEAPYIYQENDLELREGMVYTIEPGIYLPGKGGIRIEDDVVVTSDGSESLTTMDRDLRVIG